MSAANGKHSVTFEPSATKDPGGLGSFILHLSTAGAEVPEWGTVRRDEYLRKLLRKPEYGLLAGAMTTMVMKAAGWRWQIVGGSPPMREFLQESLTKRIKGGWASLITKGGQDFYGQDKGTIWEVMGLDYPDPEGGKLAPLRPPCIGLHALDPALCELTKNPEYPIIYWNPDTGRRHFLHETRVIHLVDMATNQYEYTGLGLCAVSRVLQRAAIIAKQGTLESEMLSDLPPPGAFIAQNVDWDDTVTDYEQKQDEKGNSIYRGYLVFQSQDPDRPADLKFMTFASLPENFNPLEYFKLTMLVFALGWGTDPRDFTTISEGLGTAAEAEVKHSKSLQTGTAYFRQLIADSINSKVCVGTDCLFEWVEQDTEEQYRKAQTQKETADAVSTVKSAGIMKVNEARARLFDVGLLTEEELNAPDEAPAPLEGARQLPGEPAYTPETLGDPGPDSTIEDGEVTQPDLERVAEIWRGIPELAPFAPPPGFTAGEVGLRSKLWRLFAKRQPPPARIPEPSRGPLYDIYITDMKRRAGELCRQLHAGEVGLLEWKDKARELVKTANVGAAVIGKGGWGEMTPADWGRVGAVLRNPGGGQYKYLDDFAAQLLEKAQAGEIYSQAYLENRLGLYMDAARQSFSMGAVAALGINPGDLPAHPGDGSTKCMTRCKCSWEFTPTALPGLYDAYWRLGVADHCEDCIARAGAWVPWGIVRANDESI